MSTKNAEQTFRELCSQINISCYRVQEGNEKRPDYTIIASNHKIIVEIKQFEPSKEEEKSLKDMQEKGFGVFDKKPGHRVRNAINHAGPQLKALSKGTIPAMVVLQTNIDSDYIDPYDIMTAMQGFDVVPVTSFQSQNIPPRFGAPRSGGRRKMTNRDNTTISAIAAIRTHIAGMYELDIYHNRFAVNPIEPGWLQQSQIRHWKIPAGATSSLIDWKQI